MFLFNIALIPALLRKDKVADPKVGSEAVLRSCCGRLSFLVSGVSSTIEMDVDGVPSSEA